MNIEIKNEYPNPTRDRIIKVVLRIVVLSICCFFFYKYGYKKSEAEHVVDKNVNEQLNIDWKSKYQDTLQTTYCPKDSIGNANCYYYLFDLDNNSIPELFIKVGVDNSDYVADIYTIKNEDVVKIEQIPMEDTEFCVYDNSFLYNWMHDGRQNASIIKMKDYKLSKSTIMDSYETDIYEDYEELKFNKITDYTLLNEYDR